MTQIPDKTQAADKTSSPARTPTPGKTGEAPAADATEDVVEIALAAGTVPLLLAVFWLLGFYAALVTVCGLLAAAYFVFFRRVKKHPNMPNWFVASIANLLIFLWLFSVVFLGFETYYRFIYDTTESFGLTKVTTRFWDRYVQNNSRGLRDNVEYPAKRDPNKRRITFVGDSFTVGHGIRNVEDRFVNRVRRANPAEWEVHAFAENGRDTKALEEFLLYFEGGGYEIDVTVLVYCLNDISDITPGWMTNLEQIYNRYRDNHSFFVEHSYFVNTYYFRYVTSRDPDVASYYTYLHDAYSGPVWEQQAGRLRHLKAAWEAEGGRLLVVTFPFMQNLGEGYEFRHAHEKLAALWAEEGVPHLDLLPVFEAHRDEDLAVNRFDAHPNERANELASEAIVRFLKQHVENVHEPPAENAPGEN